MTPHVPGALCLVLHSHLPWLPGHGVWPLGEEWLHQAWAESYLPVVAELDSLAAEGYRDVLTLGVTPVLAAQLDDPRMLRATRTWVGLWQQRTRELGFSPSATERRIAEHEYAAARAAEVALEGRWAAGGGPVLRSLLDAGVVEVLGGPATHPFLPLALPEVAVASLRAGLEDGTRRLGERSHGIWSPECGWAPHLAPLFDAAGVGHFVVDEQTLRDAGGHPHGAWQVAGSSVVAVPRDLDVTNLIWSSRSGYPAQGAYRDFHAREEERMTGLRLWAITSPDVAVADKRPYDPALAAAQVDRDVSHFVDAVRRRLLAAQERLGRPGLVVAAYDTELFGHWWHEGPAFLGKAVRALSAAGIQVTTLQRAVASGYVVGDLELGPGSWGAGKDFSVWDGPPVADLAHENHWMQLRWLDLVRAEQERGRLAQRRPDLDQLTQTMFHGLSSDWAFLVTRGQSVDYARRRAAGHRAQFHRLAELVAAGQHTESLEEAARQAAVDGAFPDLDVRRLFP